MRINDISFRLLAMALVCWPVVAAARNPWGSAPQTIAPAPGGFSFGSGGNGLSFSFGTGPGGGFSIGLGGNGGSSDCGSRPGGSCPSNSRPPQWSWTVPNGNSQPSYTRPRPRPTYREPEPQPRPNRQPEPSVQPNVPPEAPMSVVPAIQPEPNLAIDQGRQITPLEVERAKEFFQNRILDLTDIVQHRLPSAEFDREQLVALMASRSIAAEIQIQILDALLRGDCEAAEQIWLSLLPKLAIPFRPCPARQWLLSIRLAVQQGRSPCREYRELIRCLPPPTRLPNECCGADDLLAQLEQEIRISDAVAGIPPALFDERTEFTAYGKPQRVPTPAVAGPSLGDPYFRQGGPSASLDKPAHFGKLPPCGAPGQRVSLPTGSVNLIYHPKLPDGEMVVVNSQVVMIGTGGSGAFRIEHGRIAEALGYPVGSGRPLPARDATLVRSGILLLNPTTTDVDFVFDRRSIHLKSGYQQSLNATGSKYIAFDQGDGRRTIRRSLTLGTYGFRWKDGSLDLERAQFRVTLSNHGNRSPFYYVIQGKPAEVGPESTEEHVSDYPLVLRFDRGERGLTKQICLDQPETELQIRINPDDNLWDLYDANQIDGAPTSVLHQDTDFVPAF